MDPHCDYTAYANTGYFSKMMLDYVAEDEKLKPFYEHPVSLDGIKAAMHARTQYDTPRILLVDELRKQYQGIPLSPAQEQNLNLLLQPNTFTICTAHQPNIFTGHLYFIYKILHAVKLADQLQNQISGNYFVPFYYMGSEDADLDELGHINLNGEKLVWDTKQTGAVGRMKTDKPLIALIDKMAGELEVLEHGKEVITLFREVYVEGVSIQQATLQLVNKLFAEFGLLVLIPDNKELKRQFTQVVKKELMQQFSHALVEKTGTRLNEHYKVQAGGREINLFYLTENKRERIEKHEDGFAYEGAGRVWSEDGILAEAEEFPERFSANVILRGVFQEMILPNVAFIGGGGEIAYWLELQKVFEAAEVPFPVLIVRNSFLLVNETQLKTSQKLGFTLQDLFKKQDQLINELVTRESNLQLTFTNEKEQLLTFYRRLGQLANAIDSTLTEHTSALQTKALEKIEVLEKKMLRAEKRKFEAQQRQIGKLRQQLFPGDSLQERTDNFSPFYAMYGKKWLRMIYDASLSLEQQFAILQLK